MTVATVGLGGQRVGSIPLLNSFVLWTGLGDSGPLSFQDKCIHLGCLAGSSPHCSAH